MPRVTQEHVDARRAQILAGARRAFARYGYEGATVVRLEEEIGLSRGAIFNYFPDKLAIFVALAAETNRVYVHLILERGLATAIREMANESPEWLASLIEIESRMRHDPDFVERFRRAHEPEADAIAHWFADQQAGGVFRADVDFRDLGRFATMVINGLALRIAGEEPYDVESVLRLLTDARAPRT
jgi:AcrR family transcriptional regulator